MLKIGRALCRYFCWKLGGQMPTCRYFCWKLGGQMPILPTQFRGPCWYYLFYCLTYDPKGQNPSPCTCFLLPEFKCRREIFYPTVFLIFKWHSWVKSSEEITSVVGSKVDTILGPHHWVVIIWFHFLKKEESIYTIRRKYIQKKMVFPHLRRFLK